MTTKDDWYFRMNVLSEAAANMRLRANELLRSAAQLDLQAEAAERMAEKTPSAATE